MKKKQNRKIKTQDKKTKIDKRNSKILQLNSEETAPEKAKKVLSFGKACIVILVIILVSIVLARYVTDEDFRNFVDTKILKKEVISENLNKIDIDSENNPTIYAFDKYITVLSKSQLKLYGKSGKQVASLEVNISAPIMDSQGKYLVIGEKDGSKLYLVEDTNIVWQTEIEGDISRVNVNQNGYVSIIVKNTTYKSVIIFFNPEGKEIFKKYISSTYAICTDISSDNKYLAVGEVDYSGTIVKSKIEIISTSLVITDPENATVYTYESEAGEIIINIDYSNKKYAICMFNTYVQKVSEKANERLYDLEDNIIFFDINLKNNMAMIEKQSSGMFSYAYQMRVKSTQSKAESLYILNNSMPKSVICYQNYIGINFGNEVQIVNTNGWLVKKYTAEKEIKSLVLGNSIAGIVYKDRIEIISL